MSEVVRRIARVLRLATGIVLVVLGLINLVLIAGILVGQREIRLARASYGAARGSGSPAQFAGVDVTGRLVTTSASSVGTIVWFGTDQCPYCKADREMPRLLAALQGHGWQTIVLLPSYDRLFVAAELGLSNVDMVPFVGGEWLSQFPLVVTPTLLMLDSQHRLVWYKRGQLTPSDTMNALRVAGINSFDLATESTSHDPRLPR